MKDKCREITQIQFVYLLILVKLCSQQTAEFKHVKISQKNTVRTAKVLNPDFFTMTPGYFCMLVALNKNQSVILCVWVVFVHQVYLIF